MGEFDFGGEGGHAGGDDAVFISITLCTGYLEERMTGRVLKEAS